MPHYVTEIVMPQSPFLFFDMTASRVMKPVRYKMTFSYGTG